jgi:hypothetical protein
MESLLTGLVMLDVLVGCEFHLTIAGRTPTQPPPRRVASAIVEEYAGDVGLPAIAFSVDPWAYPVGEARPPTTTSDTTPTIPRNLTRPARIRPQRETNAVDSRCIHEPAFNEHVQLCYLHQHQRRRGGSSLSAVARGNQPLIAP